MRYTMLFAGLAIGAFIAVSWANVNTIYQVGENIGENPIGSTFTIVDEIGRMPGNIDDYWVWKSDYDISTLITYQFMHGNIFHIVGNMVMLLMFGFIIESRIQSRIILILLIAGVVGGIAHTALSGFNPIGDMIHEFISDNIPILGMIVGNSSSETLGLVGMSGSISGLVGAYLVYFPSIMNGFRIIGIWFVGMNIIPMIFFSNMISYEAHIGGFVAGIILAIILKRIEERTVRSIGPGPDDVPMRFSPSRQPI